MHGIAPPGELVGCDWWQALVPVEQSPAGQRAEVAIRAVFTDGSDERHVLGEVQLAESPPLSTPPDSELVAICMATFNPAPELFRAQVESIKAQSHGEWRCVISDDASAADLWDQALAIVGDDDRFLCVRNEDHLGFYRNFERALSRVPAEARYVALCDQDDRWHADKLSSLVRGLSPRSVLVHSDARVVSAEGEPISATFWPRGFPGDDTLASLLYANSVTGASCLFRSELLERALPFPHLAGNPFHDRWIALVAAGSGHIDRIERPLYDYVQHEAAVLGHAKASGRVENGAHEASRRPLARLRSGHRNWRELHWPVLLRSISEAIVLRQRVGENLGPHDERALRRIESLTWSRRAQLALAARHAMRASRRLPGLEGSLVRALAWRQVAIRRGRRSRDVAAGSSRSETPPVRLRAGARARIGITVTDASGGSGYGDLHVARELSAALSELGLDLRLLELRDDRWKEGARNLDVLISLHDRLPLHELPERVLTAAWIRNWTDRWIGKPWFRSYDAIFASSRVSIERIAERSQRSAAFLPLATNPERFRPRAREARFASDIVFAGNHWGGERAIARVLPRLAQDFEVKVFGSGWDAVPEMEAIQGGPIAFDEVPSAYASARLVVDDSAPHALPYGAVNARVFDALACGTPVASNDAAGVRDLFGDDVPVWHDEESLREVALGAINASSGLLELTAQLRAEVLGRHTYAHRAEQLARELALVPG